MAHFGTFNSKGIIKGFKSAGDGTDSLANHRRQFIEFYHVPTGQSVQFKAFLTQFSDGYASEWNDEDAFGRMDPISTFKGTRRIISLGWDVVAASEQEAHENLERCSLLLTMLYPVYERSDGGAQTIKASPLFKLKFLNLIQNAERENGDSAEVAGLLGKVSGLTYEPNLEAGFFDTLRALSVEGPNQLYPQEINMACEFTVLHEHELGFRADRKNRRGFERFPYNHGKHGFESPGKRPTNKATSVADRTRKKATKQLTAKGGAR